MLALDLGLLEARVSEVGSVVPTRLLPAEVTDLLRRSHTSVSACELWLPSSSGARYRAVGGGHFRPQGHLHM